MVDWVTRRQFLKASAGMSIGAGLGLGVLPSDAASLDAKKEPARMAALREKGKHKPRRIIYNNDGNEVMFAGSGTPEGFLAQRFKPILNTQVDSVFYCTGCTTIYTHLTREGETFGEFCRDDSEEYAVNLRDNLRALKDAGHDTLKLAVDFCHQHNLEIFFSHRINDIHDSVPQWDYLLSRWKREHPECLMGNREECTKSGDMNSPKYWWSALDFERPEVLDYLLRITEEVCTRYDIDGVEIDYFRSPLFFRPNLEFKPATAEQRDLLTGFQRRLRTMACRVGTQRGRPILMAARVPATLKTCQHIGIDVAQWLKEDLTDLLPVGGGYAPFTEPLHGIIKLAHAHGVPVYPTISASGMRGREGRYGSVEAWRGAASNLWRAGAKGIYSFNLFPSGPEPRFVEIGSPETLVGLDKLFVIDNVPILEGDLVQGIDQGHILPKLIPADGKAHVMRLPLGDDLPSAAKKGTLKTSPLLVQLQDPKTCDRVAVRLNGALLQPVKVNSPEGWLIFEPRPSQYRAGENRVSFRVSPSCAKDESSIEVLAVEVPVSYKPRRGAIGS